MEFKVSAINRVRCGVYRITNNINGKFYIGGTKSSFYKRYHHHLSDHKLGKNKSFLINKAYKEFGIENFTFQVIRICDKMQVEKWEQIYLDKGSDYNLCKVSGSLEGYRHPEDAKTRTVIRGAHHTAVAVDQYSLSGKYIRSFDCVSDARDAVGLISFSGIIECYNGRVYKAAGFRWTRKGVPLIERRKREGGRGYIKVSKNKEVHIFDSQTEAAEYIKSITGNCIQNQVSSAIKKSIKLKGFIIKIVKRKK